MATIRTRKVSDLIKREIATILMQGGLRDPRLGSVTITDVTTSSDLKYAKVYFSVYEEGIPVEQTTGKILNGATKYFRLQLGKRLSLRFVPELTFIEDHSVQYGIKMEKMIESLNIKKQVVNSGLDAMSDFIDGHDDFLLVSHQDPDGDTIGSVIALHLALQKKGKKSSMYCPSKIPETYTFLFDSDQEYRFLSDKELKEEYGVVVLVDMNQIERSGDFLEENIKYEKLAIIDHHITETNTKYESALVDFESAATGMLVHKLIKKLEVPLDSAMARALYVAVVTDTGGFRYSSTSKDVFLSSSELIDHGIDPWEITQNLYESHPPERIQFLGSVLKTLDVNIALGYASITISQEMFKEQGITYEDTEYYDGFINFPRSIKGVEAAVQFKEMPGDVVKISMRSKGRVDVSTIATFFGGGGHKNAAGCRINEPLEKAKKLLVDKLEESLEKS